MEDTFEKKEAIRYRHLNSVLANTHPSIFDKSILWTEENKQTYVNIYDYVTSQLQMFLLKAIMPERDLNSYIDAKVFLENFASTGNLKYLESMVSNYNKVFEWFIFDLTVVMLKTVTENHNDKFVVFVPTIPKLLWKDSNSQKLRGKTLEFDFKEDELKTLQGDNFNCIVLNEKVVEEFIDKCKREQINLMDFATDILLNKIPLIDDWYNLEELYHSIMGRGEVIKTKVYATALLYLYTQKVGIRCLIDIRETEQ